MPKKSIFISMSLVLGLILFAGTLHQIGLSQTWQIIKDFSWKYFFLVLVATFLVFILGSLRWKMILKSRGVDAKIHLLFISLISGNALSYLTPMSNLGGEPIRIMSLRREIDIEQSKAIASVIADKLLYLSANLFVVIIGIFFLFLRFALPVYWTAFIIITVSALFAIFIFLALHFIGSKKFLIKTARALFLKKIKILDSASMHILEDVETEMHYIMNIKSIDFWIIILLTIFSGLFMLLRYWLIIFLLGIQFSISSLLITIGLMFLVTTIPVPGSLGSMEASQALSFSLLGFASAGLVFSLIVRISDLFFVGLGLLFLGKYNTKVLLENKNAKFRNS